MGGAEDGQTTQEGWERGRGMGSKGMKEEVARAREESRRAKKR